MPKMHERLGLGSITTVPTVDGARPADGGRATGRAPLLELLAVAVLVAIVVPTLIVTLREQVSSARSQVVLSVSSDPSDASVIVDDLWVGRTPLDLQLSAGKEITLRVEAREPYLEYDLYKPYRSTMTLEDSRNINVWIPRTTAEEQAAQLKAAR